MATKKQPAKKEKTWAYGELTVDEIVDCALRLIQREGVAKLTMRRLADELGMSSMITYYYVPSKQEMLDLVIDRVFGDIEVPPPEFGDLTARLKQMFLNARAELVKYPGLVSVIQTRPLSPNGRRIAEIADEMLIEWGVTDELLYGGVFAIFNYYLGALAWEMQARELGPVNEAELSARFELGVDIVLSGLREVASRSRNGKGSRRRGDRTRVRQIVAERLKQP